MSGDNPELQEKIAMALSAANLMWLLCHGLTEIAPVIYIYLLFTFPWPVLFLSFHGFFFISSIASLRKERKKSNLLPSSQYCCLRDHRALHKNFDSSFSITPSVNIADSITNPSYMDLNAIQIPIRWWAPTAQRTHKQHKQASTSWYWFKSILYHAFLLPFLCNTNPVYSVPITYSLPGKNHVLIQESSLDLSR